MRSRNWVVELVATTAAVPYGVAEAVVDRLMEEGVLVLGYGDADVQKIVETFSNTFGTTKTSRYDRFAAHRLTQRYGSQAVCGIIQLLGQRIEEPYAPVPRSVADLESKWVSVLNFVRKQNSETIDA